MKKNRLFLFVLLSLFMMQATGQVINSFPWVETFEDDSETREHWTQIFESDEKEWTFASGSTGTAITEAYEGLLNARFTSTGSGVTKLVTPVLDLSEFTVYNLSFWYGQPNWFTNQNELKLYYRISDSDPWVEIDHYTEAITEWTEFTYELPEPSATYQIAFEGIDDYGRANVIDLVTVSHLSDDNDIISFTFPEEVFPAIIDSELKTVHAQVLTGTDLTSLTPVIEVSDLALITPESEETLNFESDVIYTVTAESGLEQEWTVTVTEADPLSNEKEILTFTLPEQTGPAIINNIDFTVEIEVENPTDLTSLTPTITVSEFATIDPPSETEQDFSTPFVYTVTAEDETTQDWTVHVSMEPGALGADCSNPIIINLPDDAPYLDENQATCGLGSAYSNISCNANYFNGEDIVYQVNVTEAVIATFSLSSATTWTGIGILDNCPNIGNCIASATTSATNETLADVVLIPGTYYLIISTWPPPDCIPDFDLNITIETEATCLEPGNFIVEDIMPEEVTFSWSVGFTETEWNILYGEAGFDTETEGTLIESYDSQTYNITDLTENTNYQVYIQAVCDIDDFSDWAGPFAFTTLEHCPAPSALYTENITHFSAELGWTEGAINDFWNIEVGTPGFTPEQSEELFAFDNITDNPYNAEGLDSNTGYAFFVQAECGEYSSAWVGPTFFNTLEVCPAPTEIYTSNLTNSSVTINWIPEYNNSLWTVEVGLPGFTPGEDEELMSVTNTDETSWYISGLESGTDYEVYIQANCDPDISEWSSVVEFSTIDCPENAICALYTSGDIPTDRDFSSLPGFSGCYASLTVNIPENNWIIGIDTEYQMTAENGAFMSEARSYLYSPTVGVGETELAAGTGTGGTFTYSRSNLSFANNAYGTVEIQMHAGRTWGGSGCDTYYNRVDNNTWLLTIYYDEVPNCVPPLGISISDLTSTSATINWNESISDVDGYNWVVMTEGEHPETDTPIDMGSTDDVTTSATTTDLSPITIYDVYINSICDSETSDWYGPFSFMTECDVFIEFPYTTSFEEEWTGDPEAPNCWTVVNGASGAYWEQSSVHSNTGDFSARTYQGSASNNLADEWLISPPLDFDNLDIAHMTFWAYSNQAPDGVRENLRVLLLDDIYDNVEDLHTNADLVEVVSFPASWDELFVNLGDIEGVKYVAFNYYITDEMNATFNWMYMDDLSIFEAPLCPIPNNLVVSNITDESVNLGWQESGTATLWNVEVGEPGFTPGEGEELFLFEATDQNPLFVDGLTDNTQYEFIVQAVCEDDEISEWSNSLIFNTACVAFEIPFTENFDNATLNEMPNCWTATHSNWSVSNTNNAGGNAPELRFNWSPSSVDIFRAISPELDGIGNESLMLTFLHDLNDFGGGYEVSVQISTDNQQTWTSVWSQVITGNIPAQELTIDISEIADNETFYVSWTLDGDSYQINQWYIDNIRIREMSDENDIIDFVFAEQTTPAIITGEPDYTVVIEVSAAADLNGLVPNITISDYATIDPESGLAQDFSTPFEYIVTSESGIDQEWTVHVNNAAGLLSDNDIIAFSFIEETGPAIINTDNKTVDIEVNWFANLATLVPEIEISTLATIDPPSGVAQNFTEPFEYVVTAEDESEAIWTINVSQEEAPYGATCNNPIIIDLPADAPYADVDQTTCLLGNVYNNIDCGGTYFNGEDIIYQINVTQDMVFNFDLITESTWTGIAILDECPNTGSCIAFSTSTGGDESLEEVFLEIGTYYLIISTSTSVECIPSFDLSITVACPQPINLAIEDIMQEEIWVSWEAEYVEEEWNILYGEAGFDIETEGILVEDVTSPHHITGLSEETEYDIYVQSVCGIYGDSEWTGPITVTTLASCPAPIELYAENVSDVSVDIGWFGIGGTTTWNVEVGDPGFSVDNDEELFLFTNISDNPLFIDGLTPETSYQFYVQSVCNGDVSVWTGPFSFATICSNCLVDTYTEGDIPTDYQSPWVGPSSCPASMIFEIPEGYMVAGIDVSYDITAHGGAWMSEQRSRLYSPTLEVGEPAYASGENNTAGTFNYNRTGLDFANGATGTLEIEMHAGRTWGGTGCNTDYNYVVNNTWNVTIHYQGVPQIDEIDIYEVVEDIEVCLGTSEEDAIAQLVQEITISDNEGGEHIVELSWTIDSYDSDVADTYTATGTFSLPADVAQTDPATELHVTAEVTVLELPVVSCPDNFTVDSNNPVTLTGGQPEGGEYSGVGVDNGVFNPDGLDNGDYTITYTYIDDESCENFCEFVITVDIGVGLITNNNGEIQIYPNPNNGLFIIDFADIAGITNYKIYDTKGRIIKTEDVVTNNDNKLEVNLDVAPGVYYIKVINSETTIIEKIIIQ